jgi:hypothetical protein
MLIHVAPESAPSPASANTFSSCAAARDAARTALAAGTPHVEIRLAPGVHRLTDTLRLDARDGSAAGRVTWSGTPGQTILTGALPAPKPSPRPDGLWFIPTDSPTPVTQLIVNNRRARIARYPKTGAALKISAFLPDTRELVIEARDYPWKAARPPELILHMAWADARIAIHSVQRTASPELDWTSPVRLTPHEPARSILFRRSFPIKKPGLPFFWQGDPVFITEPGEWAWTDGGLLYHPHPEESPENAAIELPILDTLVSIEGTPEAPVANLSFEGIRFTGTNWSRPRELGCLNLQAGFFSLPDTVANTQFVARPPAAFEAAHAVNLALTFCAFDHLSSTAVDWRDGIRNSSLTRCTFRDLGGGGILLGHFNDRKEEIHQPWLPSDERLITQGVRITDNDLSRIGLDSAGTCAIAAGFVRDTAIDHNAIEDVPYCGISLGWGWTRLPSALGNNSVRANRIRRAMTTMLDGGAIYTLSSMPGTVIARNHIQDIRTNPIGIGARNYAIYLDEGSDGISLVENLIQSIEGGNHHKFNPSGTNTLSGEGAFDNPSVRTEAGPR